MSKKLSKDLSKDLEKHLEELNENIRRKAYKEGYEQGKFDARMKFIDDRPPTEQEVCEALEKWIKENLVSSYDEVYYDTSRMSFEVDKYEPSICFKDGEMIFMNWFRLPPHLITLIGRFYEGKVKE